MVKLAFRRSLLVAVLALALVALAVPTASATHVVIRWTSDTGRWYHPHSTTLDTYVSAATGTKSFIDAARIEWSNDTVYNLPAASTHTGSEIHHMAYYYGDVDWAGLGEACDHCTHAHSWTNLSATSTTTASGKLYHRGTACQEIGHNLGLGHYEGDCMGAGYFANSDYDYWVGSHTIAEVKRYRAEHATPTRGVL